MREVSECCKGPLIVRGSPTGTSWYECGTCGEPCDPLPSKEHDQRIADMIDGYSRDDLGETPDF